MSTISTEPNRRPPIMPLPMPSYSYKYPNHESQPYASLPDQVGIYNPALPGTYKWEMNLPENNRNLTYLGPDWFKDPPQHYALASNWPRENYSPLMNLNTSSNRLIAAKGYVPHFTNNTHRAWKTFLNETPERVDLQQPITPSNYRGSEVIDFGSRSTNKFTNGTLESSDSASSGLGADFAQRPHMALSSQFRNNDGYRHATLYNANAWKPYGNSPAYYNTYVMSNPNFSKP